MSIQNSSVNPWDSINKSGGPQRLMEFLFGQQEEMLQPSTMTGGQSNFLSQLLGGLGGPMASGQNYLSQILGNDPQAQQAFEAPYMRQFNEQIIPGIAERFSGMGAGAQSSSAFGQAMGGAGAGLMENLASMRQQQKMNALQQLLGMGSLGLGAKSFENVFRPASLGLVGSFAGGFGEGMGKAAGAGMMG